MGTTPLPRTATPPTPWPAELVALYQERWEPMVRVATVLLGVRAEAEEVVQEAFAALAGRWSTVEHPPAYLRRSVVNGATGVLRRRRTAEAHPVDPPPDEAPTQLVELRDLLLQLPDRQRAVLVLRYVEDLPDEDIADALGCRRATVRSLAARGLAAIRRELT
jgi:RNA polymerase sigma-70 factor (sigma-E family)